MGSCGDAPSGDNPRLDRSSIDVPNGASLTGSVAWRVLGTLGFGTPWITPGGALGVPPEYAGVSAGGGVPCGIKVVGGCAPSRCATSVPSANCVEDDGAPSRVPWFGEP